MISKIINFFWNLIFPVECVVCGQDGCYWCDSCKNKIQYLDEQICLFCNKNQTTTGICESCLSQTALAEIISVAKYKDTVLEKVIHELKFNYLEKLAEDLANLLSLKIIQKQKAVELSQAVLIPIPLHKKRFLQRGFNQSELIAKIISAKFNCELKTDILYRQKSTSQQAKLDRQQRLENIKQAFRCWQPDTIKNRIVYLLDDVFTSGATMNEAAKVIRACGAQKVIALVVAHG